MIIYEEILYPKYYCDKMLKEYDAIEAQSKEVWEAIDRETSKKTEGMTEEELHQRLTDYGLGLGLEDNTSYKEAWDALRERTSKLNKHVIHIYIHKVGKDGIIEDVKRVVNSCEQSEYRDYVEYNKQILDKYQRAHIKPPKDFERETRESFEGCYNYIISYLDIPLDIFKEDPVYSKKVFSIVEDRVALWYEKPTKWKSKPEKVEAPELPRVSFRFPSTYQQGLTKANLRLFDNKIPLSALQQIEIDVTPKKGGLTTTYSVYVDMTAPELEGTENVTEYDESVHNMAVSIASSNEYGFFTAKQLATALYYGDNPNKSKASAQQVGAVTKSIEKLRHVDITVDWTEHIKLNSEDQLPEDASYKVRGYMLPVEEHEVIINGQKVKGYRIIAEPPLYKYARSVGQIGATPVKMLNVPINLDQQKLVLRDFLLKEIAHIKNTKSWNRTITTNRLLGIAGEDPETITKQKKSKLLTAVKEMLEHWTKEKDIEGYTVDLAQKGAIKSFTIQTQ